MGAFLIFVATCAAMALAGTLAILAAGFILFGVYKGASEGVFKAYVTDVVPKDLKATALGAFHTSVGLVMLPGGVIAGYLWDTVGHWSTFAYGAIMSMVAMALLFFLGLAKMNKAKTS
jgi:predicted MFS family arabinose efflux permease